MSTRETMRRLAKQESERMSGAIHYEEQLKLWDERAEQIRQESREMVRVELQSAIADLKQGISAKLNDLALKIREESLVELVVELEAPVTKMGEVIEAMERSSNRAEEKLGEMILRSERLDHIISRQAQELREFSTLIRTAERETEDLKAAVRASKEKFLHAVMTRGYRTLTIVSTIIMLTATVTSYLISSLQQPNLLTFEESQNWVIYTYDMTPEQKSQLMEKVKEKRRKIERENNSQP